MTISFHDFLALTFARFGVAIRAQYGENDVPTVEDAARIVGTIIDQLAVEYAIADASRLQLRALIIPTIQQSVTKFLNEERKNLQ